MSIELKTWYTLRDVSSAPERLVLRFLPDHFIREGQPVLTITVDRPSDHLTIASLLEPFVDDFIVDVSIGPDAVELRGEFDDAPTRIVGAKIHHEWSGYATDELLKTASAFEDMLATAHAENVRLRKDKRNSEEFVFELLRRAEAKRTQSSKSTAASEAQIDVLGRVLNQLNGA